MQIAGGRHPQTVGLGFPVLDETALLWGEWPDAAKARRSLADPDGIKVDIPDRGREVCRACDGEEARIPTKVRAIFLQWC